MERYIDKLKRASVPDTVVASGEPKKKERIEAQNPCVVCSVTMGKELHTGHLFLITVAEQMRNALKSPHPLILINNNTGPRAAGALCEISSREYISLQESAYLMDKGSIETQDIVEAYRSRSQDPSRIREAMLVISSGGYDIFSRISQETESLLTNLGINIQILSESQLLQQGLLKTTQLAPEWTDSGFTPFRKDRRLVILQKGGALTASGTLFTAIASVSDRIQADLVLAVDSMPDSADATFVYSSTSNTGNGFQLPGAGIGFGGRLASGTKGESLTIKELSDKFSSERPSESLVEAAIFLTLTMPVSISGSEQPSLTNSFYDFMDNNAVVGALISCSDRLVRFRNRLDREIEGLLAKVGLESETSNKPAKSLLQFLPQRSRSLLRGDIEGVLATSKKINIVNKADQIEVYSQTLGYTDTKINPYLSGKRKLGIRRNYYFDFLNSLLRTIKGIDSLKRDECAVIIQMIQFCRERLGI